MAYPPDIAEQLGIDEKTLRKHFREELNSGKFKVDMGAGRTIVELMKSKDERVRLEAAKYYTSRRMGWKETTTQHSRQREPGAASKKIAVVRIVAGCWRFQNGAAENYRRGAVRFFC